VELNPVISRRITAEALAHLLAREAMPAQIGFHELVNLLLCKSGHVPVIEDIRVVLLEAREELLPAADLFLLRSLRKARVDYGGDRVHSLRAAPYWTCAPTLSAKSLVLLSVILVLLLVLGLVWWRFGAFDLGLEPLEHRFHCRAIILGERIVLDGRAR
jgi:hypothetical protein